MQVHPRFTPSWTETGAATNADELLPTVPFTFYLRHYTMEWNNKDAVPQQVWIPNTSNTAVHFETQRKKTRMNAVASSVPEVRRCRLKPAETRVETELASEYGGGPLCTIISSP